MFLLHGDPVHKDSDGDDNATCPRAQRSDSTLCGFFWDSVMLQVRLNLLQKNCRASFDSIDPSCCKKVCWGFLEPSPHFGVRLSGKESPPPGPPSPLTPSSPLLRPPPPPSPPPTLNGEASAALSALPSLKFKGQVAAEAGWHCTAPHTSATPQDTLTTPWRNYLFVGVIAMR